MSGRNCILPPPPERGDAWGWFALFAVLALVVGVVRDCQVRHVDDGDDSIHVVIRSP